MQEKTKVPPHNAVLDFTVDADKLKASERNSNDNAYHELLLENAQTLPFNIVDKAILVDLTDGDAAKEWTGI